MVVMTNQGIKFVNEAVPTAQEYKNSHQEGVPTVQEYQNSDQISIWLSK